MKLIDLLVQELPKRGGWPDGSTRCMQTDGMYVTFPDIGDHCDFVAKCMADGVRIATRDQYEAALAASKTPAWNGEGLPPVGAECEYKDYSTSEWHAVTITYCSNQIVVFSSKHKTFKGEPVEISKDLVIDSPEFRPIRTEAELKRKAAIEAIAEICRSSASNGHSAEMIYAAIEAGNIRGVKLEVTP